MFISVISVGRRAQEMRQDRGAATADGDSWCFNRPLRAPPADLRAGRPGTAGLHRACAARSAGHRWPHVLQPPGPSSVRTQRRNPEIAGGARGSQRGGALAPSVWKLLRTCAELEKPHPGSRLQGVPWRESRSRVQAVPCTHPTPGGQAGESRLGQSTPRCPLDLTAQPCVCPGRSQVQS